MRGQFSLSLTALDLPAVSLSVLAQSLFKHTAEEVMPLNKIRQYLVWARTPNICYG